MSRLLAGGRQSPPSGGPGPSDALTQLTLVVSRRLECAGVHGLPLPLAASSQDRTAEGALPFHQLPVLPVPGSMLRAVAAFPSTTHLH